MTKYIALALSIFSATVLVAAPPIFVKSTSNLGPGKISATENAVYAHPRGLEMMTSSARSSDDGKTWLPFRPTPNFDGNLRKGFRRSVYPAFCDPVEDVLLSVVLALDVPDLDPNIVEPPIGENEYYLRYRVSTDGGKSFLFDDRIVQDGKYSDRHPIDDVWLGKNGYYLGDVGCIPLRTREGKILVPVQVPLLGADGELSLPGGGFTYQYSRMLIGEWINGHRIRWDVSNKIIGNPDHTSRGLFEPTLAQFSDGRILCIMRGSNGGKRDADCKWAAGKWASLSSDGGRNWSTPQLWTYSDGTSLYSPSSMSQLLTLGDGRIFWIGNATETNCCANNPRYPLVIGQVDPDTAGLIKTSTIVIDTLGPDDKAGLNLSHWLAYEDRATGDIRIPMRRWSGDYAKFQGVEYTIGVARP